VWQSYTVFFEKRPIASANRHAMGNFGYNIKHLGNKKCRWASINANKLVPLHQSFEINFLEITILQ